MSDGYNTLVPLIKKTGSRLSPKDFQEAVNVIFHDVEANYYDSLHQNMWQSLQDQINLLVDDLLNHKSVSQGNLSLLDIGCGTGLSTQLLLNSKLGKYIDRVTLLDTSPNMLKQAEIKSRGWNKKVDTFNSDITGVRTRHDIILVCSVLHHIPDLKQFLGQLDQLQTSGAIFIHLQDPNGDYVGDVQYAERTAEYAKQNRLTQVKRKLTALVPGKVKDFINKKFRSEPYIDMVNEKLISKNIIKNRMSSADIWSVTDIHSEHLPYSTQAGISYKFLLETLVNYEPVARRSYAFYGPLKSELTSKFQNLEAAHIENRELNGRQISAVWMKK